MLFKDIIGLEDIKRVLIRTVQNQQVAHAQLFLGHEGSANLAMAWAYATYLNCENKQADDACGQCASCLKFTKLIHPDFHFVFPIQGGKNVFSQDFMKEWRAFLLKSPYQNLTTWQQQLGLENKQAFISAEEGRNILRTLSLKSFEAYYKIVLIWLPEYMNTTAANAILKILEEPPEKTLFLLVAQQIEKILPTILSRVQLTKIRNFTDEEIKENILAQFPQKSQESISTAIYLAEGNLTEAFQLMDAIEDDIHEVFRQWMRVCYKMDMSELVNWTEKFHQLEKEVQKKFFQYSLNICHEVLIWHTQGQEKVRLAGAALEFVKGFSKVIQQEHLERFYYVLNTAFNHLERNANAKILFLDTSLQVAQIMR